MRFGRKLALALQNDTEDAPFISHKHLKEILSRQVREIRSLNDMANKESQEANSSKETIRIMDSHFFATMDSDVEAMLAYIGTKQEGLARSVAALVVRAQQAGLIDQDNQPPNGMLNSTLTQVCVVMSQLGSLLSGYLVQCAAYSQLTMILSGSLSLGMDMARELETVTEEANKLLAYIDINVAGMRKLLKQHDKQIPVEYQKRPIGSAPYTSHHRLLTDGVLRAVTELNKVRTSIQGLFQVLQAVNAPGLEQLGSLPPLAEVHLGSECELVLGLRAKILLSRQSPSTATPSPLASPPPYSSPMGMTPGKVGLDDAIKSVFH